MSRNSVIGNFTSIDASKEVKDTLNKRLEQGAFGSLMVENLTPIYHIKGLYNQINTRLVETFTSNGSVTNSDAMFNIIGNTGILDYAVLRSRRQINYQAGTGTLTRFTTVFDTGTAGYQQISGAGVSGNGLFFGYNGTQFAILRQTGGVGEVRRLEITTAENSSTTAVVTLNSVAFNVTLTNAGGATEFTAYQVAETAMSGWDIESIGDFIYFTATGTGAKSGTYSYANGGGASAGTFTQITPGATETYNWTNQEDWNIDTMDGNGPTKMVLNPQKGNVYQIRYQWLGFGELDFYIEDDQTGKFQLVHSIKYTNRNTVPSLRRPSLKSLFAVYSAGG
ncbi:MAG: hypothetical protein ACW99Q_11550, partial [Candidatus Kariarchaeaceae archaeon]